MPCVWELFTKTSSLRRIAKKAMIRDTASCSNTSAVPCRCCWRKNDSSTSMYLKMVFNMTIIKPTLGCGSKEICFCRPAVNEKRSGYLIHRSSIVRAAWKDLTALQKVRIAPHAKLSARRCWKKSWHLLAVASFKTGKHKTTCNSVNAIFFWTQRMYPFHQGSAIHLEAERMAEKAKWCKPYLCMVILSGCNVLDRCVSK